MCQIHRNFVTITTKQKRLSMDITVLFKLTYGLYVVGCMDGDRPVG